jgi:serine/threonine-protein kinase HipA
MTSSLVVVLEGVPVGLVERTRSNVLRFSYDDTTLASTRLTPLSLSMPRGGRRSFVGEQVEVFLRALLPDSDGALAALARQHPGLDRHDPLSVLDAIGKDCPGAVQFCAPDDVEQVLDRPGRLIPVSSADVEQRLAELRLDDNASWTMRDEHWSLGGTQAKFALRRDGEAWFEAEGAQPTTHILKPGVRGLRSQSLVEHVSMRAAAECGVSVAHTEHLEFKSESAVVVTRFDRRQDGSRLVRLHQEDLCQALGVSENYEEHAGPSAHDVIELLRERSRNRADAQANVGRFVDQLAYNTVVAAPDAHARNYAVLLEGDRVTLAPAFDVATGLAYDSAGERRLSMSIGGEFRAERISRQHWIAFSTVNGLDPEQVVSRVHELAEHVPAAMLTALDEIDDWDGAVAELRARLEPALTEHLAGVVARLGTA